MITFTTVNELAMALRQAEQAHKAHEKATGLPDDNWPAFYARYLRYLAASQGKEKVK